MQMLQIDGVLFKEMVEHGLREFPNEACGLLAGRDGSPVRFFALKNLDLLLKGQLPAGLAGKRSRRVTSSWPSTGWTTTATSS